MSSQSASSQRPYRKRRRAEAERRTRRRITEAAVKLHGTVGPARTSISAVAREAGVQRATVYRHFPSEADLFAACSAHWLASNPPPDPGAWAAVPDHSRRLHAALTELYRWYGESERMIELTSRDASLVPAMAAAAERARALASAMAEALMEGRPERGAARRRAAAAVAHALAFSTWRSLTREQDLDDAAAVELMAALVEIAGRAGAKRRPPA